MHGLALLAFLINSLIPAGYMPDAKAGGDGLLRLVICTSYGMKEITVTPDGKRVTDEANDHAPQDSGHSNEKDNTSSCPFGLTHPATAALQAPDTTVGRLTYALLKPAAPDDHPATATLCKTAPPRAPPFLS